jgi:DNA-directed RNA polymerase III subunit RPC1
MNITLGVPRIKEIINASKTISSPIITAPLTASREIKSARIVKGRIERTTLGDVAEWIEEFYSPQECYLAIKLDLAAIDRLQLSVTAESVVRSILDCKKLKLKGGVRARAADIIRVTPPPTAGPAGAREDDDSGLIFTLHRLRSALPGVIVQGVPNVNRAVINDKGDGTFHLLVEGHQQHT